MAITITSAATGMFDPTTRDQATFIQKLRYADGSTGTAAQRVTAQNELEKSADFQVSFTTPDNAALSNVMKLSGTSSRGVTFPAATFRTIKMVMRSSNDADTFYQEIEQDVWGNDGTTPVLGAARLCRAFMLDAGVYLQMGRAHLRSAQDGTEATDGMSSPGFTTAAMTNGTAALAYPPSRAVRVIGVNFAADTYNAATGCVPHVAIMDGDGSARIDVAAADDGLADTTPGTGVLDIECEFWPLAQVQLVLNSTAVEVHARTTLSDVFTHSLEVTVGKAISVALGA